MASPGLAIRRLVVEGELGCDLSFHSGVNVIAAEQGDDPRHSNTCGKTTLVELIRCGLGRRYSGYQEFHELAQIRSRVKTLWLEIEANGKTLLIERSLDSLTGLMRLHRCSFADRGAQWDIAVSPADLSPIALDLLAIPEVSVKQRDGSLALFTFQLLQRAFILHQEDSFFAILDKVEPEARRGQIIGFLTGIRPADTFLIEPELAQAQVTHDAIKQQFEQVSGFLLAHGIASALEARGRVENAAAGLRDAQRTLRDMQDRIRNSAEHQGAESTGKIQGLRSELLRAGREETELQRSLDGLQAHSTRLTALLASLKADGRKLRHVRASTDILSAMRFQTCPRCLQTLTTEMLGREEYGRCSLCARPILANSDDVPRAIPQQDEIEQEIGETEALLTEAESDVESTTSRLNQIRGRIAELEKQLDLETRSYVSPAVDRLAGQAETVAACSADLAQAQAMLRQAEALQKIESALGQAKERLARLDAQVRAARVSSAQRIRLMRDIYEAIVRAVQLPDIRHVDIDEVDFTPHFNGASYRGMGTGLKGVAVVAYHLAMLRLSLVTDSYFPRFLVIDSPAVGDLNEVNHAALLRYIASLHTAPATEKEASFQLILTTRKLVPELEPSVIETLHAPNRMLLREH